MNEKPGQKIKPDIRLNMFIKIKIMPREKNVATHHLGDCFANMSLLEEESTLLADLPAFESLRSACATTAC